MVPETAAKLVKRRGRPSKLDDKTYVTQLSALYPTHTTKELSEILKVNLRTVQDHCKSLGLTSQAPEIETPAAVQSDAGN